MSGDHLLTRRSALRGASGAAAAVAGRPGWALAQEGTPVPAATRVVDIIRVPLWTPAADRGILYGTSLATWQLDPDYARLVHHQAAILFTEDDLLWYKLRPTPGANLDFQYGDQFVALAEQQQQLVLGAHLIWDEGFGEGWTEDDLWGMDGETARRLILDTIDAVVGRYRGRVAG